MKQYRIVSLAGIWLSALLAGGCADLKVPYPAKSYFMVDPGNPNAAGGVEPQDPALTGTLKVRQIRVAAPFNGDAFVYKVGPNQYIADYYDAFLMPTDRMLTMQLCGWLTQSGLFTHVVDAESTIRGGYTLEGSASCFMIDVTDPHAHRAVVDGQFFLLRSSETGPEIIFSKSYTISTAVKSSGRSAEVDAWSEACRSMFVDLTADIRQSLTVTK
jgi:ABC-type uncharacterized transport system auxiliary subunit